MTLKIIQNALPPLLLLLSGELVFRLKGLYNTDCSPTLTTERRGHEHLLHVSTNERFARKHLLDALTTERRGHEWLLHPLTTER